MSVPDAYKKDRHHYRVVRYTDDEAIYATGHDRPGGWVCLSVGVVVLLIGVLISAGRVPGSEAIWRTFFLVGTLFALGGTEHLLGAGRVVVKLRFRERTYSMANSLTWFRFRDGTFDEIEAVCLESESRKSGSREFGCTRVVCVAYLVWRDPGRKAFPLYGWGTKADGRRGLGEWSEHLGVSAIDNAGEERT